MPAPTTAEPTTETQLADRALVGSSHLYRIEWDATEVRYYVDGALVATHAANFGATQMRPIASDLTPAAPRRTVDWMRMSPYPGSGTFDSRVFDAGVGQTADWGALSWNSATPSGTGIAISVRTGNTPTPDGTWSAFAPIDSQRRRHPGQQPLRPVPGTADEQRPGPDADPERGLDRLRAGSGQHRSDDHQPHPVAERDRTSPATPTSRSSSASR